ncbi:cysteine hydrolase [Rhodococcus sp. 06-412-2C]|uniref:isochorismatase family protein n=1 Tax=unclassified Rhodococcus (in: high G+C Gram-positive bacteria) TaxID=192944 RepID=UPI000B9A8E37|nr:MULTISPECIES: isochorismatase family protein [unclassified Rhodococcus (in: high G+C Gram-positive bacteria)]OZC81819.1 cysteine hydrolase [Rhodococcus sp. 06-412-2C]OZC95955.1 cysteine hydrolase [Rhodococcus sp. 06-412-2B]
MTTLPDRHATALLIVDVQNDVMVGAHERERVIDNIVSLVTRARETGTAVIWVQHSAEEELHFGTDGWKLLEALPVASSDPIVHKKHGDAFEDTTLEAELTAAEAGHVVVAGAQTDFCVRSTLHGALVRGYDVTLASDAHTTEDLTKWGAPLPEQVIAHTNLYWDNQTAPGRTAAAVATKDIDFT